MDKYLINFRKKPRFKHVVIKTLTKLTFIIVLVVVVFLKTGDVEEFLFAPGIGTREGDSIRLLKNI